MSTAPPDPIALLVDSLEDHGKPPLSWVIEWSRAGAEPVLAAWEASEDPWAMVQLLMRTGRDWPLGRYSMVDGRGLRRSSAPADDAMSRQYIILGEGSDPSFLQCDANGAAEIRRRVPAPPSLAALLGGGRRARFRGR